MVVLSGYRHEEIHRPLEDAGWERTDIDVALNVSRIEGVGSAPRRTESVWRNPASVAAWHAARAQGHLFTGEDQ